MAAKTAYAAAVVDSYPAFFLFQKSHGPGSADADAVAAAEAGIVIYFRPGGKGVPESLDRPGENKIKKLGL